MIQETSYIMGEKLYNQSEIVHKRVLSMLLSGDLSTMWVAEHGNMYRRKYRFVYFFIYTGTLTEVDMWYVYHGEFVHNLLMWQSQGFSLGCSRVSDSWGWRKTKYLLRKKRSLNFKCMLTVMNKKAEKNSHDMVYHK